MKKTFLFLALVCPMLLMAAEPGFGERKYSLTLMGEYSYNTTWGHHGNVDLKSLMPINPYFEMEAKVQVSSAKVYTGALQLRPKFELPVGELFLETDLMYRGVVRNQLFDFTAGLGLGYRMDYVSITLGAFCRVMDDLHRDWHTTDTYVVEPFNLLYRVEVFCRPQNCNWNLSFLCANVDDFQMERQWQPLFGIGAWCDVAEHCRLNFSAQCKPTGMFHLDASFYGATARVGFTYRF